jgi:antagonist of KipI
MLEVLSPSVLTTIQDTGRRGWQAYGVPVSGPMDDFAHHAANFLVANPPEAAALEIGYSSASFLAQADCLIAATGPGFALFIDERPMRMWTSVYVRKNWRIRLEKMGDGNWATLAIHGGIVTQPALGSRAIYLRAQLGEDTARPLQSGDTIPIGAPSHPLIELASRSMSPVIDYSPSPIIHVIPGPQVSHFAPNILSTFYSSTYTISPSSDRTGYRLNGPALERTTKGELISEGMARGCIQIPADGLPIVMQADCPTTGGYPKIASAISIDQPLLAQVPVGTGQIHFVETTIEEAQARYREMMNGLAKSIVQPEMEDYSW